MMRDSTRNPPASNATAFKLNIVTRQLRLQLGIVAGFGDRLGIDMGHHPIRPRLNLHGHSPSSSHTTNFQLVSAIRSNVKPHHTLLDLQVKVVSWKVRKGPRRS